MSQRQSGAVTVEKIVMSANATLTVTPPVGVLTQGLRYGSGGTLVVCGSGASTLAVADGWPVPASEVFRIDGSCSFVLGNTGVTTTAFVIRQMSQSGV